MRKTFNMRTEIRGKNTVLTVDDQPVPNVSSAELIAPAGGLTRLIITQTFLDGHASGEAEVQFVRRLLGRLPRPETDQAPDPQVRHSVKALAHDLLATADQAGVVGGGTVTLDDGRKAHVLYAITGEPHAREIATEPAGTANESG